jgi:hypothetical protein
VAHPFRQLAQVRPGVCDQKIPGVAQVVEMDTGQAGCGKSCQRFLYS